MKTNRYKTTTHDHSVYTIQQGWFKNLSDTQIPTEIVDLVKLGPTFSIKQTSNNADIIFTIKNLEY